MSTQPDLDAITEEVTRKYHACACEYLAQRIVGDAQRHELCVTLLELINEPDPSDYSERGVARAISMCRMLEDGLPGRERRLEHRASVVSHVAQAILRSHGMAPATRPLVAAAPAAPHAPKPIRCSEEEGTSPERAGQVPLDISAELASEASTAAARFRGGPPDLHLYPGHRGKGNHIPGDYIALLVPPPAIASGARALGAWVRGEPVSPETFALGLGELDDKGHFLMAEVEADFLAAPDIHIRRHGQDVVARDPRLAKAADTSRAILMALSDQLEETQHSDLGILTRFRDAVARTFLAIWPHKAERLREEGATLRTGDELMEMLRQAWTLEECWLREFGGALSGPEQNIIGSPLPEGRMEPGLLFQRAVFLHLASGAHMADTILEAALDLRYSMAIRGQDAETTALISQTFDEAIREDCARPVSSYRIAKIEADFPL